MNILEHRRTYFEDSTFLAQIVPSLASASGSPLGKRPRSTSSSLSSVFDDLEDQPSGTKRRAGQEVSLGEETTFPYDLELHTPPSLSAESRTSELDCFDLATVDFPDFASSSSGISTTSQQQQQQQVNPTLDFQSLFAFAQHPMHHQASSLPSHLACGFPDKEPKLVILEQAEEYYRARYESEGVRAPLKGINDNYPTVKVVGQCQYGGRVDVELVYEDGTRHLSCSLDVNEERKNALSKKIGPHDNMTAQFEDLRIRREIRSKKKPELGGKKIDKIPGSRMDGRNDKVACLLFTATLDMGVETKPRILTVISRPITLSTPPDPAELDWVRPESGHYRGGDEIVIKGSKMTSPKVVFHISLPNPSGTAQYDLPAIVEKDKSHQNVLLVKTPSLPQALVECMPHKEAVRATVTVSTGRSTRQSNELAFWFIPDDCCNKCMQQIKMQQPISSPPCAIPLSASPPPTSMCTSSSFPMTSNGMMMIKPHSGSMPTMSTPVMHPLPQQSIRRISVPMLTIHHPRKHEMPTLSLPSSSQHPQLRQHPVINHFPPSHAAGSVGMDTGIDPTSFCLSPGFFAAPSPIVTAVPVPLHETKPFTVSGLATAVHTGSDVDLLNFLMGQTDKESSNSSPEPDDDVDVMDFPADFVSGPNLSPFAGMSGLGPCTNSASPSSYIGQLSPSPAASPPGCNTPPCYSPITPPMTSPQQDTVNLGMFCGNVHVPGSSYAVSQPIVTTHM